MNLPSGINGLVGREPIGAALAVGKKGPTGAPVEKDRFHVLLPERQASDGDRKPMGGLRAPHPSFSSFNGAEPDRRRVVSARLAHATVPELFSWRRQAQQVAVAGKSVAHPRQRPVCLGNGGEKDGVAWRWDPAKPDLQEIPGWVGYRSITCPGDRCPFAQEGSGPRGQGTACKPWMRFLARFDWPRDAAGKGLPNLPFKYTSSSWGTVNAFVGLFAGFERACRAMGLDPASIPLFGLPVVLQLQERTDAGQQRRFPVVSITVAGDGDLIAWIAAQASRLQDARRITSSPVVGLLIEDPDDVAADIDLISAGSIPA